MKMLKSFTQFINESEERDIAADFTDLLDRGLLSPTDYALAMAKHVPKKWLTVQVNLTFDWTWGDQHTEDDVIHWLKYWFIEPGEDGPEGFVVDPKSIGIIEWSNSFNSEDDEDDDEDDDDENEDDYTYIDYSTYHIASFEMVCPREAFSKEKMDEWAEDQAGHPIDYVEYEVEYLKESKVYESLDQLQGLKELMNRGFLTREDYYATALKIAKEHGLDFMDILVDDQPLFNIQDTQEVNLDDDNDLGDVLKRALSEWEGDRGEKVIAARGEQDGYDFSLAITISTGAEIKFVHKRKGDRNHVSINYNGKAFFLQADVVEEIEEEYEASYSDDAETERLQNYLSAAAELVYGR